MNTPLAIYGLQDFAAGLFARLHEVSFDGVGITRASFGPGEDAAHDVIDAIAVAEGLHVERDGARNLIVTLPGREPDAPFIACGSHLDSVPQGGNYDGAAGVVAGLTAIVHMKRAGIVPPRSVKVMALRGEEGAWFGKSWIGARAMLGRLTRDDLALKRHATGETLRACMAAAGADFARIERAEPLLAPQRFAAYLELHIEQGPVMVERKLPVAVVTGIFGIMRHQRIVCRGQADHAGAVPRSLRRDALIAAADLVGRLDRRWGEIVDGGGELRVTFGIFGTQADKHSLARVPGEVEFSLDARGLPMEAVRDYYAFLRREAQVVETQRGVRFEFDQLLESPPALMDERWMAHFDHICTRLDIRHERMPSGAGHDAAVFMHAGIPTAMLFIRNDRGSHNPDEAMDMPDFMAGTAVLAEALCTPLL